jgi:LPPG:FO 2-phospho-L-lactate transferase
MSRVTILAGGFGGAKLSHGMALEAAARAASDRPPLELTVIVNTADDLELHGLHVSPDLDTVMYTLAGLANTETGWGVRDETWSAAEMFARYGAPTWFRLGDRDLATHVRRTQRIREGARLTDVTAELAAALALPARLLPMTDDRVRTQVRTADGWLEFQDYFVRRGHRDDVRELRFQGIESAAPTGEVLDELGSAEAIAIAPSNPFVSVGPILALPGLLDAIRRVREGTRTPVVAVSPIVAGAALRGPADQMFVSLGGEASALGVARHYASRYPGLLDVLVVDELDAEASPAIEALGIRAVVAQTIMRADTDRRALAAAVIDAAIGDDVVAGR